MDRAEEDLLVLAAQSGDSRAFELLYRRYSGPLARFSYGLCGNRQMASDAVQEAWITLSRSLHGLRDPRGFRLWAYKTVRWRTVDQLRRQPKGQEPLEETDVSAEPKAQIATPDQLARHLAMLPTAEKTVLTLFYLEGLTIAEIAALEGIPAGTVKSRLNRARSRLKDRMTGEDNDQV